MNLQTMNFSKPWTYDFLYKPVLGAHSNIDKTKVLKTGGSLVQVDSIAEKSKRLLVLKTYFVIIQNEKARFLIHVTVPCLISMHMFR